MEVALHAMEIHMMALCEVQQWEVWLSDWEFSCSWPQIIRCNRSVDVSAVLLLLHNVADDATLLPHRNTPGNSSTWQKM